MFKPPLLAVAAVIQLLTQCGSGAASSSQALNTESYLGAAVDAQNLFHWTPISPGQPIPLGVILRNAPSELPPGLLALGVESAELESLVTEAMQIWIDALGEPVEWTLYAHGGTPLPQGNDCGIEVSFLDAADGVLSGYAWLDTRFLQPRVVNGVKVELSIPLEPQGANLVTLKALVLHELGHAFGIVAPPPHTGHSSAISDVMHPSVRWTRLSNQDRLAIRELYKLKPNIERADAVGGSDPDGPGGTGGAGGALGEWLEPAANWVGQGWEASKPRSQARQTQPGCRDCR